MHKVKLFFSIALLSVVLINCAEEESTDASNTDQMQATAEIIESVGNNLGLVFDELDGDMLLMMASKMKAKALNTKPMASCTFFTDSITLPSTDDDGCTRACADSEFSITCAEGGHGK